MMNRLPVATAVLLALSFLAARSEAGAVIFASGGDGTIEKYSAATGADLGTFASGLSYPTGLAFDAAGNLFVADASNNDVVKYTPGGVASVFTSAGLYVPTGLVFDPAGNLYVANYYGQIAKFAPNGTGGLFATDERGVQGLAFDAAGNLYVANGVYNRIDEFSPTGAFIGTFASTGLNQPTGLVFDAAGNLYASNAGDNTVEKFTPGGVGSVYATTGLDTPLGIVFDAAGNLYAANADTIGKIAPDGTGTFLASVPQGPYFLAIQPAAVPEPSSLLLCGLGMVGLAVVGRKTTRSISRQCDQPRPGSSATVSVEAGTPVNA